MLADWKNFVPKFVKVMPQDYKRDLAAAVAQKSAVAGLERRRRHHGGIRGKREGRPLNQPYF
jgi:hypothetical protein